MIPEDFFVDYSRVTRLVIDYIQTRLNVSNRAAFAARLFLYLANSGLLLVFAARIREIYEA